MDGIHRVSAHRPGRSQVGLWRPSFGNREGLGGRDLQLLVDGKSIAEASAKPVPVATVLDRMHDFDMGSGIAIADLNAVQIENLLTLGRVWGFLKYHHPAVAAGQFHWDYELLRVLQLVVKSGSKAESEKVVVAWIDRLGAVSPCKPCSRLDETNLDLEPNLG